MAQTTEKTVGNLQQMGRDAFASAKDSAQSFKEKVRDVASDALPEIEDVQERFSKAASSLIKRARYTTEEVSGWVQSNPGKSMVIGLGIGWVLGNLLMKRSR